MYGPQQPVPAEYREAKDAATKDPNGGFLSADLGRSNPNHAAELEAAIVNAVPNDITPDGDLLYTNGSAVFRIASEGRREQLFAHTKIEQVVGL